MIIVTQIGKGGGNGKILMMMIKMMICSYINILIHKDNVYTCTILFHSGHKILNSFIIINWEFKHFFFFFLFSFTIHSKHILQVFKESSFVFLDYENGLVCFFLINEPLCNQCLETRHITIFLFWTNPKKRKNSYHNYCS